MSNQSSEDYQYEQYKKWFSFYKSHKMITPQEVGISISSMKETQPYKFLISSIDSMKISSFQENKPSDKYSIRIFANFFSKTKNVFFGRTYQSTPFQLRLNNERGSLDLINPIAINYFSKLEINQNVSVIIEFQIIKMNHQNVILEQVNLGYIDANPWLFQNQVYEMKKGSPRQYLIGNLENNQNAYIKVSCQVVNALQLLDIKQFIPDSCLVGCDENIPGIRGQYLPFDDNQIKIELTSKLILSNIKILFPTAYENQIIKYAKAYSTSKNKGQEIDVDIQMIEKRFVAFYHNGWNAVNTRGMQNYCLMINNGIVKDELELKSSVYEFQGQLDIDNVFLDEQVQLIFEFHIKVQIKAKDGKEEVNFVVGFLPYHLQDVQQQLILSNECLITGPGKSIQGDKIVDFGTLSEKNQILFSTKIEIGSASNIQMMKVPQIQNQNTINDQQIVQSIQNQQYQKEIENLRNQIDSMQKLNKTNTTNDFKLNVDANVQILEHQRNQEQEMQRHIEAIKNSQNSIFLQKQKEFDDIKQMLLTLKQEKQSSFQNQTQPINDTTNQVQFIQKQPINELNVNIINGLSAKDISRADQTLLAENIPHIQLDDFKDSDKQQKHQKIKRQNLNVNLKNELENSKKASVFIIQFFGIKPQIQNFQSITAIDSQSLVQNYYVPQNLYMTLNFFDFPTFKTHRITYKNQQKVGQIFQQNKFLIFTKDAFLKGTDDIEEIIYKFEVDPSITAQKQNSKKFTSTHYENFIKYLYKKTLSIDIWDADSLLLYGSVKVPLRHMLNQGKQVQTSAKEYNIIDPSFDKIKGTLQLLMKNLQKAPAFQDHLTDDLKGLNPSGNMTSKKKVKSVAPISIPADYKDKKPLSKQDLANMKDNLETRLQKRIQNYKIKQFDSYSDINNKNSAETNNYDLKEKQINLIAQYKEQNKSKYINEVIKNYLSEERILDVYTAKSEVFSYEIHNNTDTKQLFNIHFDDPDQSHLIKPELMLVKDQTEWQYWVNKKNFEKPNVWDMLREDSFILEPNEKIHLVFKFLSFRNVSLDQNKESSSEFITSRTINVFVNRSNGGIYCGFVLRVNPHNQIVDHVFRYFERANRRCQIKLPAQYYFNAVTTVRPSIYITYPKATVEWISNQELLLQLQAPQPAKILKFNIYAFEDQYNSEILGNWQIEIHSLIGMDMKVDMGQQVSQPFSIPGDSKSRVCRLYSSNPMTVFFDQPFDKEFTLAPGKFTNCNVNVRSFSSQSQKTQINCVDLGSKELVYSVLLNIETDSPNPNIQLDVVAFKSNDSIQQFVYSNRNPEWKTFELTSSQPNIVQVIESRVSINAGDRENIRIKLLKQNVDQNKNVFIFITDNDAIFDCILLNIQYK